MYSPQLAAYYSICILLALLTLKGTRSTILKLTSAILASAFLLLAANQLLQTGIGIFAYALLIIAGSLFIIAISPRQNLNGIEKSALIIYTTAIIAFALFKILYLNGINEIIIICTTLMIVTGGMFAYKKLVKKSPNSNDIIETTGLFTCFLLPSTVALLQLLAN